MRLDKGQIFAVVATVLLNAVLFLLLLVQAPSRPQHDRHDQDAGLQVVWIDPVLEEPAPPAAMEHPSIEAAHVPQPLIHPKIDVAQARQPGNAAPLRRPIAVVAEDMWSPLPGDDSQDQATPTESFEHNPLAGRAPILEAETSSLRVEIRDRSVGGWIQRQTKRSMCSDLKRQLMSAQGSGADAIVATMGRYGCNT